MPLNLILNYIKTPSTNYDMRMLNVFVYTTRNGSWSVSVLFLPESGAPDPVSERSACWALTRAKNDKMNHIFENQCSSNAVNSQIAVRCWKKTKKKH